MKCPNCGYEWEPRKERPKSCPDCKARLKAGSIIDKTRLECIETLLNARHRVDFFGLKLFVVETEVFFTSDKSMTAKIRFLNGDEIILHADTPECKIAGYEQEWEPEVEPPKTITVGGVTYERTA